MRRYHAAACPPSTASWPRRGLQRRPFGLCVAIRELAQRFRAAVLAASTRRPSLGHAFTRVALSPQAKAKASKLEQSSTKPAAVNARNPLETKS